MKYPRYFYLFRPADVGDGEKILYIFFRKRGSHGTLHYKDGTDELFSFITINKIITWSNSYREVKPEELALLI